MYGVRPGCTGRLYELSVYGRVQAQKVTPVFMAARTNGSCRLHSTQGLPEHRRSPQITSWTPQVTADHYRSSNPNLSTNHNLNPNPLTRTLTLTIILTTAWTVHLRWSAVFRQTARHMLLNAPHDSKFPIRHSFGVIGPVRAPGL